MIFLNTINIFKTLNKHKTLIINICFKQENNALFLSKHNFY